MNSLKLLGFLLYVAINSSKKEEIIEGIQNLSFDDQTAIMEIIRLLQEKYSQESDNGFDNDSDCLEERYHELCQKYNLLLEENEHLRINMDVYQVIKSSMNIFGFNFIFD